MLKDALTPVNININRIVVIYQCITRTVKDLLSIHCIRWFTYYTWSCLNWSCSHRSTYLLNTFSHKSFRLPDYPTCKDIWWWALCSLSTITKIIVCCCIKLIPIHPYFICINTIIITNTAVCTFNIRIFNVTKTNLFWQRNT